MSERTSMTSALRRAIEAIGGPSAVARHTGISSQAVGQWDICPPLRVARMSELSGVPTYELRPDIFPVPHGSSPSGSVGLEDDGSAGSCPVPSTAVAAQEAAR